MSLSRSNSSHVDHRNNPSLRFLFYAVVALAFLVLFGTPLGLQRTHAQQDDAYQAEVLKANDLLRRRRYEDALKSYKRANDMHDKKSAECYYGMAQAYNSLEAYKNVVESCEKAVEFGGADTQIQAQALNLEGIALQSQAAVKDQKKLQDAEGAFRKALALNIDLPIVHYNLGYTLMQLGRDPEGMVELKKYLELQPEATNAESATKLIENPRRAREAYAPDFSITTADGEYISIDDLHGKVVLLDFWGTWCPPCVSAVPALRDLHKRFTKEPLFKMISVSTDADETKWRGFIDKNQMAWTHYLDRDHHVVRAFNVHAFPTYILIDAEGIVRYREITTSWERTGDLADAIKKYLKLAVKPGSTE